MGTSSMIAIIDEDGCGTAMQCHFDGYPEGIAPVLYKWYNNLPDVEDLVFTGYMSSLGPVPDDDPDNYHLPVTFSGGFDGLQEVASRHGCTWVYAFVEGSEWVYAGIRGPAKSVDTFVDRMGAAFDDRIAHVWYRFERKNKEEAAGRRSNILIF